MKVNFKIQVKLWALKGSANLKLEHTFFDITLAETGQKKDIHYNPDTMKWSKITAEDEKYIYYKGLNGKVLREQKGKDSMQRKVIYEKNIFAFCGMDQSYLYVLEPAEEQSYNVRKINKDGTTSKIILEEVKYVLLFKDDDIYYVPSFSENQIYKMNRSTLEEEKFCEFEDCTVEYMSDENDQLFVVTQEEGLIFMFLGPDCLYYRVAKNGDILQKYESDISPQDCMKTTFSNYVTAYLLVTNGYLRETAEKVYWLSHDTQTVVETETISGWHPTEQGIFTEQNGAEGKYDVVLYQAANGEKMTVTTVNSKTAFFTFVQDQTGKWYFMDQTETDLELYQMDEQLHRKSLIAKISLQDIPCDLENCNMEIVNRKLFFYTMTDWSKSKVLYRYNLY